MERKLTLPLSSLASFAYYRRKGNAVRIPEPANEPGIVAEFKRRSPSRGPINMDAEAVQVASAYEASGVSAMSVLTDRDFFGGSLDDLKAVREFCPKLALLRKDFIIDPYQLHEASAFGADMVLLIGAILDQREVEDLALEAVSLGMQVLFEVHNREELEKYHPAIGYVGVNNRDLKTFRVDTGRSLELMASFPTGPVPVSESGLSDPQEIRKLSSAGYRLFLMGENFMKEKDPGKACKRFMDEL